MIYKFDSTGKDVNGQLELIFTEGPYEGVSFIYHSMKFADEPNGDGTINMSFEYDITNGKTVDENFETTLGDTLIHVLEEQIARSEVVYKGGSDDGALVETTS